MNTGVTKTQNSENILKIDGRPCGSCNNFAKPKNCLLRFAKKNIELV